MTANVDASLIDWSRAQFAMTAMYHWIFVPLTLGLGLIMSVMESIYFRTGNPFWKRTAKFWMRLFGINFAIGVATGLILEFEFGTNWSNYSWFVGDIFGAPLAIEGILAFFMEATFIAVMFFGWEKVSKRFHLASTWLTTLGATISAWWILVANSWMQYPVGMEFNPVTVRNEMVDFFAVAFSPVAVNKFLHTVLSGWVLGAVFVIGISCWFLLKRRNKEFAVASIKVGGICGLFAILTTILTGHDSAKIIAEVQPMKLAAMEGLYEGGTKVGLVGMGMLNPQKERYDDGVKPFIFRWELPGMLSFGVGGDVNTYVPGIKNILEGGYTLPDGTLALSAAEKMERGKKAIEAFNAFRVAHNAGDEATAQAAATVLKENMPYFGYAYISNPHDLVPNVPVNFYAFRIMVLLGCYFILFFCLTLWLAYRKDIGRHRWMQRLALISIPLVYINSQAGWVVAEVGRQPWIIQDMMPTGAALSKLSATSVQITFFIFLLIFATMLAAGIGIMVNTIRKGPEESALAGK